MLLPASFRGAPFAVTSSSMGGGRRNAMHQYPGRDTPWAEDMGRAARTFQLRGFVLDGDIILLGLPVGLQRSILKAALEKKGSGTLIHPTLGALTVSVDRFSMGEGTDAQSMSSIDISFVESGSQSFPAVAASQSGLTKAITVLTAAMAGDGVGAISAAFGAGSSVAQAAASAASYIGLAATLAVDATALYRLAAVLPGSLGRFDAGGNSGLSGTNPSPYAAGTTIADLVPIASAARVAVGTAGMAFAAAIQSADLTSATAVPITGQAMVNALQSACADPADGIRLMLLLMAAIPTGIPTPMTVAISAIITSAAAAALTNAMAAYQPTSANDAAARIAAIAPAIDALATSAADAGQDATYSALRQCRAAIVTELRAAGSTLAQIKTFSFGRPLPALVLAQSIYGDATRADGLVGQVVPINPLFMPTTFQALAA